MRWFLAILILSVPPVLGDEPKPVPPVPQPTPVPVISIVASKDISGTGKKKDPYVFTSSTKCLLRLSVPSDSVKWDVDDAPSDVEILDNRFVAFSLYEAGTFQVTAYGEGVYSKVWFTIKSGTDPPAPQPGPEPTPSPDDGKTTGLIRVLIIRDGETLSNLPQSQINQFSSQKLREYCDSHCAKGANGKTPELKIYDEATDVSAQSAQIKEAFKIAIDDMAKANSAGPWIVISNGKTGVSQPLPLTEADTLKLLKKYGGE